LNLPHTPNSANCCTLQLYDSGVNNLCGRQP
jgi:hypothetical protein